MAFRVARSEALSSWAAPDSICNLLLEITKPTTNTSLSNLEVNLTLAIALLF
jgi:hypothetical protein